MTKKLQNFFFCQMFLFFFIPPSAHSDRFICDNLALPVPCHWERINTDEPYQVSQATLFLPCLVALWQHKRTCSVETQWYENVTSCEQFSQCNCFSEQ